MPKGAPVKMRRRSLIAALLVIIVGFGLITGRLWYLQFVEGSELQGMAISQQMRDTTIRANRGTIYDRNGTVLAQSATVWTVYISPKYLEVKNNEVKTEEKRTLLADKLSEILEVDRDSLYEKTGQLSSYYVTVKRQIEKDVRDEILQLKKDYPEISSAIGMEEDTKRYYPFGDFASVVLGFTGYDNQGLAGIESYYDKYLQGTPGRLLAARNAVGTDMPFEYEVMEDAKDGNNLTLTIDEGVQHFLEKYLKQAIEDNNVETYVTGIIMDVNTFEILARSKLPAFDPNDPFTISNENALEEIMALPEEEQTAAISNAQAQQWRNNAISDSYEPGSVFKIVTASAALDEGVVTKANTFECPGYYKVAGQIIRCNNRAGHGHQTFAEALQNSCNPAFMQIGELLGIPSFCRYYSAFGLTEKTGIDLPGEMQPVAGVHYHTEESMGPVELASSSFGQSRKVTPLQMITAMATVVNGGNLGTPHVVSQITDADGNIVETMDGGIKRQVISESTSQQMVEMLEQVVEKGGGKNARVDGYRVGGKTGTSEKLDSGDSSARIASFCGFAPVEDPQIACIILVDEPHGSSSYGSVVAAPIFKNIMSEVLPYLGIEKTVEDDSDDTATATPKVIKSTVEDAKAEIKKSGLLCRVVGSGDTVLSQLPDPGTQLAEGGTVVIFTDEESKAKTVTVPNLTGLSVIEVNDRAAQAGINVRFSGVTTGQQIKSVRQSIEEGTQVSPGTIIDVEFVSSDTQD